MSVSPLIAHSGLEIGLDLFSYQSFSPLSNDGKLVLEGEKHLKNVKQLTFGSENAEAYFSNDGKQLIFQSKRDNCGCDQIYTMNADGSNQKMVSNGDGRTTCSYFLKGGKKILYGTTF